MMDESEKANSDSSLSPWSLLVAPVGTGIRGSGHFTEGSIVGPDTPYSVVPTAIKQPFRISAFDPGNVQVCSVIQVELVQRQR